MNEKKTKKETTKLLQTLKLKIVLRALRFLFYCTQKKK